MSGPARLTPAAAERARPVDTDEHAAEVACLEQAQLHARLALRNVERWRAAWHPEPDTADRLAALAGEVLARIDGALTALGEGSPA